MNDQPTEETRPLQLEAEEEPSKEELEAEAQRVAEEIAEVGEIQKRALTIDIPKPTDEGLPYWVRIPAGFAFPRGKMVLFLKFKSAWTDAPWKGEPILDRATGKNQVDANGEVILWRQCVVWPINTADKKLALGRAMRDPNKAADEMAKQMIRVADGIQSDWATVQANGVEMFWNELGEKCRVLLIKVFAKLHVLDQENTQDFLEHCIEARSTGG